MSSMFKKKGGPAFKPKIPAARRPAAPASSQPPKPSPASVPPPVSDESRYQQTSQETSESSSPKETVTAPVEPKPQDSHHDGQPPTPPSTNPEPAKPHDAATSQKASQEKSPEESQQVAEVRDVVTRTEKVVAPVATPKPAAVVVTESATEQIQPRSKQQQDQLPSTGEHFSQPNVPQASDSESVASPVLQTPTPDDSESPSGTEPSTTSSPPAGDSNESQPAPSTEQNIPKPTRKTRARKQTTQETQDENGTEDAPPKKRQRKTAEDGATPKQPRKRKSSAQSGTNTPKNRRARSLTPEDSESQLVDLQKLKMADLTKDLHIGKKFSRHDELRERERRARMKSKLGTNEERDSSATPDASGQVDKTGSPAASPAPPAPAPAAPSGPQFRIVDGQIVIDQSSLSVDRHARAAAAAGDMETVEENDFTRLITSNSFMNTSKLKGPNIWTEEETELFYRGLCMFGTDFEMISKMFPGKQRRNVKLKYNREERHCPRRITAALVGEKTVKININEYKAFTGSEFEPVDAIEAEQRKIQEEYEAEEKRRADEQAEVMRKRREELFKDDEDGDAKKKKKKKKQTVIYGLNGEPIVQEE